MLDAGRRFLTPKGIEILTRFYHQFASQIGLGLRNKFSIARHIEYLNDIICIMLHKGEGDGYQIEQGWS
jgi:hypothetical protein